MQVGNRGLHHHCSQGVGFVSNLILLPCFDGVDDSVPVKADLDNLIDHIVINDGVAGHGVSLNDCQVAGQVLTEPWVLPASQSDLA